MVRSRVVFKNSSSFFEEYREIRLYQVLEGEVNIFEVIDTLDSYAKDPKYQAKLKDVVTSLLEDYPLIFKMN